MKNGLRFMRLLKLKIVSLEYKGAFILNNHLMLQALADNQEALLAECF